MSSFGQTIKLARFKQLLEGKEAANKMGICQQYLSRIENDKFPPTKQTIKSALRCGFITQEESIEFINQMFEKSNKPTCS